MDFNVHVYLHNQQTTDEKLDAIMAAITHQGEEMSAELDALTTEVTEIGTVSESAIALLNGLSERIKELQDDPVALAALAAELDAKKDALAAAVAANTPEPPTP